MDKIINTVSQIAQLGMGEDYTYRQRLALGSGLGLRSSRLSKYINIGSAIVNDPLGVIFDGLPGNVAPKDKVNQMEFYSKNLTTEKTPRDSLRFAKANASKMKVRIHLVSKSDAKKYGDPFLELNFTPSNLDYQVIGDTKALNIIGSDLQTYHYGGSETTFTFTYCWYGFKAREDSPMDKAKKMASLITSSGWAKSSPPLIWLEWGVGSDTPFSGEYYLVQSAPFKPRQFTLDYRDTKGFTRENQFHPAYVEQTITLKRVR